MGETHNIHPIKLSKINDNKIVKDYLIAEIKERELMSEGPSKYIACFDYFDKLLIVLPATSGGRSIIGAPVGIASASFSFAFSITTGI